jgi:Protein of unknown function (DUF2384)
MLVLATLMNLTIPQDLAGASPYKNEVVDAAAWEAMHYLQRRWDWNGSEIARALRVPISTVNFWLAHKRVPVGRPPFAPVAEAVLHLLAIHRSLEAMFSESANQRAWLETKHPELGFVPVQKMRESFSGLTFIRQYLDYVRGRGA